MLHCNNSTALEDFSDGILVDSKHSNRLDNGEMEISMDSDQVSSETLNASRLKDLFVKGSLFAPLCMFSERYTIRLSPRPDLLALCACKKFKNTRSCRKKALYRWSIVGMLWLEMMKSREVLRDPHVARPSFSSVGSRFPKKGAKDLIFPLDV